MVWTDPLDDPHSDSPITYAADFISEPVKQPVPAVAVSQRDAEALAVRDQYFGEDVQPGSPTTVLRWVTLGVPDEPRTPHLAWVLTWNDSRVIIRGGISTSFAKKQEMAAKTRCVFIVVINATSGEAEDVRQICRGG